MNKLRKLTWKYFFEQKWEEMSLILGIVFIILSIVGVIVQTGWICVQEQNYPICDSHTIGIPNCGCSVPYETILPRWMMYSGFVPITFWILFGLFCWIESNWKKAKKRAKGELK